LAIAERQTKTLAPNVPKSLDVISGWLVVSLPDRYQVCELHLKYSCNKILMELLLKIGPCDDEICEQGGKRSKGWPIQTVRVGIDESSEHLFQ
jgi:hypothetical protein